MPNAKIVSVRYHADDFKKLEQLALIAGYKSLSTYIRDKSLGRSRHDAGLQSDPHGWVDQQVMATQVEKLEESMRTVRALLSAQLGLIAREASPRLVVELAIACREADVPSDILRTMEPELAQAIDSLRPHR